jgi:hypothetical protein
MKALLILFLLLTCQTGFGQVRLTNLAKSSIPKSVQYTGNLVKSVRYQDSQGDNIVVTTETGETKSKGMPDEGYRDAALFAFRYALEGNAWKLKWKVTDFIKECPVDLKANFIKNTFAVTDLNKNGQAEIWLMYKTVCHGDVSPSTMKIIMYEGDQKYAVRGTNKVKVSETETAGGNYNFDAAFKNGPEAFRNYAAQLWKKNLLETWE